MKKRNFTHTLIAAALTASFGLSAQAADLPGNGFTVLPLQNSLAEETFQTILVTRALKKLGYDVQPIKEVQYPLAHLAAANGDATFMANHWNPHHSELYSRP
jgi:glycine betaine/proline transport system substrate-binding protein